MALIINRLTNQIIRKNRNPKPLYSLALDWNKQDEREPFLVMDEKFYYNVFRKKWKK